VKQRQFINIISEITYNCNLTSYQNIWYLYKIDTKTGLNPQEIALENNLNSELVVPPYTLSYGLYRFVFTVSLCDLYSEIETYVKIIPSGLVLSTLDQSEGIYGGLIEISRGTNQSISFDPFLNTYDLDSFVEITTLTFKYACQVIDSDIQQGYPLNPQTNRTINLDEFKLSTSLRRLLTCFNSTG
jgi:hypothetical protein